MLTMIRSNSSLGRLYRIRTTPMCVVTRTHLIPSFCSTIGTAVTSDENLIYTASCCNRRTRGLSQQAAPDSGTKVEANGLPVSITTTRAVDHNDLLKPKGEIKSACGDVNTTADDDQETMEQEDMFVEAHESFEHTKKEWGGPRRGGRLPEPTRFGDWERKGRCSDF